MPISLKEGAAIYRFKDATKRAAWCKKQLGQYFTTQRAENGMWYITKTDK